MSGHGDCNAAPDLEAIKARFIKRRGYWRPWTEVLLRENPRFLERYATYAGHPAEHGPLSPRLIELIYVALDASATHLFGAGLRLHIELALKAGATRGELHDVFHRVALQGMDRMFQAVGVLADAVRPDQALLGRAEGASPDAAQYARRMDGDAASRLRDRAGANVIRFLSERDPEFVVPLSDLIEHGRPEPGLSAADRVLIDVALHACFTGYDRLALSRSIALAFELGRTEAELLQAIQLGAHLAIHGTALGASVLAEMDDPDRPAPA